jgi:hypothetical protein
LKPVDRAIELPTKQKLDFPRFYILVEDLAKLIRHTNVPVCKGAVRFLGEWPSKEKKEGEADAIHIRAHFGVNWDGFEIGYELTADVPPARYGQTRLAMDDLKNLRIRYTDDQLEAEARRKVPVEELIKLLRQPENQVPDHYPSMVPGGEMIEFSAPLKALMFRGKEARAPLLAQVDDLAIRNEVVLALGAVGDEKVIAELISRYPSGPVDRKDRAAMLTRVCFSYALCWLTGQAIDRSRYGTDLKPNDAEKWKDWWTANRENFCVPAAKPYATWVPHYPVLTEEHIARIKKMFAERGDDRLSMSKAKPARQQLRIMKPQPSTAYEGKSRQPESNERRDGLCDPGHQQAYPEYEIVWGSHGDYGGHRAPRDHTLAFRLRDQWGKYHSNVIWVPPEALTSITVGWVKKMVARGTK